MARHGARRRWQPNVLTWTISVLALLGLSIFMYPKVAAWYSQYNQSALIANYAEEVDKAQPSKAVQLAEARSYNDALSAGAVLKANTNKPSGDDSQDTPFQYNEILRVDDYGLMARIKIPSISVDLPIFHGTADDTLLRGAGHLEGSSLPVGGESTHSVITAHRGLANATMFTNLDRVVVGDRFTVEVFDEVLTYEVTDTIVVAPDETETLRTREGYDLVTLITCTPLGINSHRILVTGERVTPTPIEDVVAAGKDPEIPGFPWWAVVLGGSLVVVGGFVWSSGYSDARLKDAKLRRRQKNASA